MTAGDQPPRQREPQPRRQEASETSSTRGTYNDTGTRATPSGKQLSFPGKDLATYLKARVNGRDQECLLDSGSEVSVIPASLVRKSDIQQTDQSLKAVNGTGIKILGEAELPVNTSKYQTTVKGLVTEHVSEVLLGIDWLTENNADWNFRDGSVSLNGYRHKLNTRPKGQKWCRRVVVQEDTEVSPRSEQNLGCRVMFHGASKCQADQRWETAVSYTHLTLPTILRV